MKRAWIIFACLLAFYARAGAPVFDGVVMDGVVAEGPLPPSGFSWWVTSPETQIDGTATTKYVNPYASMLTDLTATQADATIIIPANGMLSDLGCAVDSDLGAGTDTLTTTLQHNADALSAPADTSVACTITGGGAETCTDTDSLSVSTGDIVVFKVVTTDTPTSIFNFLTCRLKFTPSTSNQTVWGFHLSPSVDWTSTYRVPMGTSESHGTAAGSGMLIAASGTITGIACAQNTDLTGTMVRTFDFVVAGTPQSDVACTFDDTHQECADTGSISVTAGDLVVVRDTPANTPSTGTKVACGVVFEPTIAGRWVYATYDSIGPGSSTVYGRPHDGQVYGWSGSEVARNPPFPNVAARAIYASVTTAPGADGDARAFTVREAGADSALACSIVDAATSCNATTDVTVEAGNAISLSAVPTIIGGSIAAPGITRTGTAWSAP